MKKSLIALAVMAASGAAMAQSNVTLYGIVDLWVGSVSTTNAADVKTSETKMESGGVSGSRWGLMGSEDLGGGLKGIFKIESGFSADTGAGNSGPNRQTYVGVESGFGTVTLGNVYSAMDDVLGAGNSGFDSALSAHNLVTSVNDLYESNPKNAIKYVSPSFGGFSGGFTYSLDETPGKTNQTDFSLSYGAGPIAANFAYEIQGDAVGSNDLKLTALNGSYDLGMVKLIASFGQAKLASVKSTDFQFGADIPLSSALTVSAGFAQSKENAAGGNGKRTGFGVAAAYSLSKRTTVYGGFRSAKGKTGLLLDSVEDNAATTTVDESYAGSKKASVFAVGLKHTF